MANIDELNTHVTAALRKVEEAQTELVYAEMAIANVTTPNSVEGKFARRGAIRAAREAGLDQLVENLLKSFLSEKGIDPEFGTQLKLIAKQ